MSLVAKLIYFLELMMPKVGKLLAGIAIGFGIGIASGFVRADRVRVAEMMIHYGIALALSGVLVIQLWLARRYQSRWIGIGYAVGWIGATLVLGAQDTSGDLVLPGSALSMVYVLLGAIGVAMFAVLPPMRPPEDHKSAFEQAWTAESSPTPPISSD